MASLLGQFYSRIDGSQEDIASEGLAYILQKSASARQALSKLIEFDTELQFEDINYQTQTVGDELERPDVSGYDNFGKEVIILEAKFWASLTDNQPVNYLKRLDKNSVLVFIVPDLRVRPVFSELQRRLQEAKIETISNNVTHSFVINDNKHLIVKTWKQILSTLKAQLVQNNEQALISDIDQIIGFCEVIDSNAFLPIQDKDLSPSIAKRVKSYCDLIDRVVAELKKRGVADTTGFRVTGQKYGYTSFFKINSFGCALSVRYDYWENGADTPFWVSVNDDISNGAKWAMTEQLKTKLTTKLKREPYSVSSFPLFPPIGKTEDLVVDDIATQIEELTTL